MASVLIEEGCEVPDGLRTLADFRQWTQTSHFPQRGRIDWIGSRIEVDMSPEDLFTHGSLKSAIVARLWELARDRGMHVFTGETRVSSVAGDVSAEPDLVVVSEESLADGCVRAVPAASGKPDRFVEFEGAVDLIVEIVSDSSVAKDTRRLPPAYRAAGVQEFWLIDARGDDVRFEIHRWGERAADHANAISAGGEDAAASGTSEAAHVSSVFATAFTIHRTRNPAGRYVYDLVPIEDGCCS